MAGIAATFSPIPLAPVCPAFAETVHRFTLVGYTVDDIAARTGLPERTVRRRFAAWARRGWPRVSREPCRGDSAGRLVVDAAEYEAMARGEITEAPAQAA